MNTKTQLFVTIVLLFSAFLGCSQSDNPVMTPGTGRNILNNSLFEMAGSPSMSGWSATRQDTSSLHFSTDAPPGAMVSINLGKSLPSPMCLYQHVPAPPGTHSYRLSFWAKEQSGGGRVYLEVQTADSFRSESLQFTAGTDWRYYSLEKTISTAQGDSLAVELVGGFMPPSVEGACTYFAICKLELLE